jgi:hypothetical protein
MRDSKLKPELGKVDMPIKKDQKQLFEELYLLQNCELALGAFYQELTTAYPGERFFWEEAVSDEVNHARWVGQLIAIVSTGIDKFMLGQYRAELLKTYIEGIYSEIARIKSGQISRQEVEALILNYERSKVEQRPFDIVRSTHPDYINLVMASNPQIGEHSARIQAYVKQKLNEHERVN